MVNRADKLERNGAGSFIAAVKRGEPRAVNECLDALGP